MPQINCYLCKNSGANSERAGNRSAFYVECKTCGSYEISHNLTLMAERFRDVNEQFAKVAYILSAISREYAETKAGIPPMFTPDNYLSLTKAYPVPDVSNIKAKAEKLLIRIREKTDYFGQGVELFHSTDYPLAYAKNPEEFRALLSLLDDDELVDMFKDKSINGVRSNELTVTSKGWDMVHSLRGPNLNSEQGFVAIWFDDSMNDSIEAISQAVTDAGFHPLCIREEHFSEKIMDKALGEIRKSRFIVVDLSGSRNSVFFEAGFAFGLGIDIIYVYKQIEGDQPTGLEFYVKHYQCYSYSSPADLREKLKNAITARIKKP